MEKSADETVIIVHGTWAAPEPDQFAKRRWYEPVDGRPGDEPFTAKLNAALEERGSPARCWAHCPQGDKVLQWSGENSWVARTQAATSLGKYVAKLQKEGWRCHIVAHSHGGNVLIEALPQIMSGYAAGQERGRLVTLGTPFMDVMSPVLKKYEWRQTNLTVISLVLVASLLFSTYTNLPALSRVFQPGPVFATISDILPWLTLILGISFVGMLLIQTFRVIDPDATVEKRRSWLLYVALATGVLLTDSLFGQTLSSSMGQLLSLPFNMLTDADGSPTSLAFVAALLAPALAVIVSKIGLRSPSYWGLYTSGTTGRWSCWAAHYLFCLLFMVLFNAMWVQLGFVLFWTAGLLAQGRPGAVGVNICVLLEALVLLYVADRHLFTFAGLASPAVSFHLDDARNPRRPILLAISSQMDEAWQLLYQIRQCSDPLSIKTSFSGYMLSALQRTISERLAVARVHGAKSYSELGAVAKFVAVSIYIFIAAGATYIIYWLYRDATSELGLLLVVFTLKLAGAMTTTFIVLLMGITSLFGASFLSGFLSPFRWCFQVARSLLDIPGELGVYLLRNRSWSLLLGMAMGLEGYRYSLPLIEQFPSFAPDSVVRYENMPKGAEQRALDKRSTWISRHLGDVSETFSKLAITAADISSLLRIVEQDQTLVHSAYYTDEECIARIADWISQRGALGPDAALRE
ncbi:hypothetical protein [Bradyrhizobium sp. HKCCYLS3013]|uniref:hypothetical protein n=1 Tax=Bradyrhizobium sp. HKCCYLS3013 TaxID=3420735 RepID=UPI003EBF5095